MKRYEKYKNSGVDWIGEIPEEWEMLANKFIFSLKKDVVGRRSSEYELLSLTLKGVIKRDMVNPDSNELFSNSVVSRYDLCDAIIDGVLPKPIYKSGYVYLDKTVDYLEERLSKLDHNSKDYKELSPMLKDIKRRLQLQ